MPLLLLSKERRLVSLAVDNREGTRRNTFYPLFFLPSLPLCRSHQFTLSSILRMCGNYVLSISSVSLRRHEASQRYNLSSDPPLTPRRNAASIVGALHHPPQNTFAYRCSRCLSRLTHIFRRVSSVFVSS